MKKINLIFIAAFIVELIVILVSYYYLANKCGSACDLHSFLNPFGIGQPGFCIQICAYVPHPLFYIFSDLLIITIVIYLIYLFRRNKR